MTLEDLTERIFVILRDELLDANEQFTPESDLLAYGLESLALTQLLLSVEELTGVWVDESSITKEAVASTTAFAKIVYAQLDSA